jgi:uncharacterized phage-associated protein
MYKAPFSDRKATHAAAYLLLLAGGRMSMLKLMKLIYMAEKLSYARFGDPLVGDDPYSLKDGPILSAVYDRAKGKAPKGSVWHEFISPRDRNEISLVARPLDIEDLGSLSEADIGVLEAVWRKFGRLTPWEVRNYTHEFPEWEDPASKKKNRLPIKPEKLLQSVGYTPEEAAQRQKELEHEARAQRMFCASA